MRAQEWFARFPVLALEPVFTLRVVLGRDASGRDERCLIRVYEGPETSAVGRGTTHTTLYCELQHAGRVLFPREQFTVGIPHGDCLDSDYAKAAVLSLFALKPGDTDEDFFEHYTPEQLDFCERYGEALSLEALNRYGEF